MNRSYRRWMDIWMDIYIRCVCARKIGKGGKEVTFVTFGGGSFDAFDAVFIGKVIIRRLLK